MKFFLIGLISIALFSCFNSNRNNQRKEYAIDLTELRFQKGDCVSFKLDSINSGVGIVVDYSKDEGGIWYGLCFTDYMDSIKPLISDVKKHQLSGRKIESSFENKGFFIGLDEIFVNDSCFKRNENKFQVIGRLNLNNDKIKSGSEAATHEYDQILNFFYDDREKRKTPPDDYREHLTKMKNFKPEEYFPIRDFINE